ncbi:hypothetical protein [Paenibacillus sp. TH7-28]
MPQATIYGRFQLNKDYVMRLTNVNLLRSFYMEAGLWSYSGNGGTTTASTTNISTSESSGIRG